MRPYDQEVTARITTELAKALELLAGLALCGYEDWGGSWVNLQVDKESIEDARQFLKEIGHD